MPVWRLTSDGALTVGAERALVGEWLPTGAAEGPRGRAHLLIDAKPLGVVAPSGRATLSLLDVGAWIDGDGVILRNDDGTLDGVLELAGPGGTLGITAGRPAEPLLTIAMALTLGRLGRALVHAAGVVAPDGKAWLLVGDTHAGKSTTVATLVRAGWGWLADDQVVVHRSPSGLVAEGWPRAPNLDAGFAEGSVTGTRRGVTLEAFGALPLRGTHPVGGVILPRVVGDQPTRIEMSSAADVFVSLVRQSPWLLADAQSAPRLNELLAGIAALPAVRLELGKDSYGRGAVLSGVLGPMTGGREGLAGA